MIFLVDRNIEGYATLLLGSLTVGGWLELVSIRFVLLEDIVPITSSDRNIWRFAQAHQMILLTANRSGKGIDSSERTV